MTKLSSIVSFLDQKLKVAEFEDSSNNGLQVENDSDIYRICCGVSASIELFEEAKLRDANLVVCHHGISWGDSLKRITELNYRRVAFLVRNDIALYACHLPLDAHPRYGNNALICKALGLRDLKEFGAYGSVKLGFSGKLPKPMRYSSFKKLVGTIVDTDNMRTMDFGKKTVRTVGVVSGGAGDVLAEAGQQGLDVYLSGEPKLAAYDLAQEYGINAIFAGHHATEVFGVRALAKVLKRRFKIESEFADLKIPY